MKCLCSATLVLLITKSFALNAKDKSELKWILHLLIWITLSLLELLPSCFLCFSFWRFAVWFEVGLGDPNSCRQSKQPNLVFALKQDRASPVRGKMLWVKSIFSWEFSSDMTRWWPSPTRTCVCLSESFTEAPLVCFQLFRRVAAALPGMDSTPEKSKEDSILFTKLSQHSFVAGKQCSCWYRVTVTTEQQKIHSQYTQIQWWRRLTKLPQWSTSNWRSSQRWPSPRAAARASTLPPSSASPHHRHHHPSSSLRPPAPPSDPGWQTRLFFDAPLFVFPPTVPLVSTWWLYRVTLWMCITVMKPIIWRKGKTRNMFSNLLDSYQLHGIIYDCGLT